LMRDRLAHVEVRVIEDAHPGYVVLQRPAECARLVQRHVDHAGSSAR
jgi:hypothetical protein